MDTSWDYLAVNIMETTATVEEISKTATMQSYDTKRIIVFTYEYKNQLSIVE